MKLTNTYVQFVDKISGKVVHTSIQFLIECGVPIDEDGDDMDVLSDELTQNETPEDLDIDIEPFHFYSEGDEVSVEQTDSHYAFHGTIDSIHYDTDGSVY